MGARVPRPARAVNVGRRPVPGPAIRQRLGEGNIGNDSFIHRRATGESGSDSPATGAPAIHSESGEGVAVVAIAAKRARASLTERPSASAPSGRRERMECAPRSQPRWTRGGWGCYSGEYEERAGARPPASDRRSAGLPSALEMTDVTKAYDGRTVVDHVTFAVEPGEIFGLVGPNGSGKTTTIRMALDIVRPDEGTVRLLGDAPSRDALARVGYLTRRARPLSSLQRHRHPGLPGPPQAARFVDGRGSGSGLAGAGGALRARHKEGPGALPWDGADRAVHGRPPP